jgi:hypothetical protein
MYKTINKMKESLNKNSISHYIWKSIKFKIVTMAEKFVISC